MAERARAILEEVTGRYGWTLSALEVQHLFLLDPPTLAVSEAVKLPQGDLGPQTPGRVSPAPPARSEGRPVGSQLLRRVGRTGVRRHHPALHRARRTHPDEEVTHASAVQDLPLQGIRSEPGHGGSPSHHPQRRPKGGRAPLTPEPLRGWSPGVMREPPAVSPDSRIRPSHKPRSSAGHLQAFANCADAGSRASWREGRKARQDAGFGLVETRGF
jgi:hypothetical protein